MKNRHLVFFDGSFTPGSSEAVVSISKITSAGIFQAEDLLSVEEPLEIRLAHGTNEMKETRSISVTMRTPGFDEELAVGFLFTEGILNREMLVYSNDRTLFACGEGRENIIQIYLESGAIPDLSNSNRNFYTTSSCGVCGKSSIASIRTVSQFSGNQEDGPVISGSIFYGLSEKLRASQQIFERTGGLHASGLFSRDGELIISREDVGRHNALDKLIGHAFLNKLLPLDDHILLLSGRASFELIQKAVMAGIRIVAAIGAPSTLAVELAREFDVTLIGFLRDNSFNIYSAARRISNLL